jgi:alpha-tubulin suppressor-like RCC1 family protein
MPTYDGTYKLAVEDGRTLIRDVEGGSLSTHVPLEIYSNYAAQGTLTDSRQLRLRTQPYLESNAANAYVTDMGIQNTTDNYFFITAPQNTSNVGDQNTFVISKTSNVGIGTTDPQQPLHVVGDSWITGTLTTSNIVGASPVTISSNLVMASGFTLTAETIAPPPGGESNLNITGTITTSNITHETELTVTSNLLMGSDKTLTTSNIIANTGNNLLVGSNLVVSSGTTLTGGSTASITNSNTFPKFIFSRNANASLNHVGGAHNSSRHVVFPSEDGKAWAVGIGNKGALGLGDTTNRNVYTLVSALDGVANIVASSATGYLGSIDFEQTMLLDDTGNVWTCGINQQGQLGHGDTKDRYIPTLVTTNIYSSVSITEVSTGGGGALVLDSTGQIWGAGYNGDYRIGNLSGVAGTALSNTTSTFIPSMPAGDHTFTSIDIGEQYSLALEDNGRIWSTGGNGDGRAGGGATDPVPGWTEVDNTGGINDVSITQIVSGETHSVALDSTGNVWATGDNNYGQLGLGDTTDRTYFTKVTANVNVASGVTISQIAAAFARTWALDTAGKIWTAGYNLNGEAGQPPYKTTINTFIRADAGPIADKSITDIALSSQASPIVRTSDNEYWVTGNGGNSCLGTGDTTNRYQYTKLMDVNANPPKDYGYTRSLLLENTETGKGPSIELKNKNAVSSRIQMEDGASGKMNIGFVDASFDPKLSGGDGAVLEPFQERAQSNTMTRGVTINQSGGTMVAGGETANVGFNTPVLSSGLPGTANYGYASSYWISGGNAFITTEGKVYFAGGNPNGQAGDGTTSGKLEWVESTPPSSYPIVAHAQGDDHSVVLDSNGQLWGAGRNNRGQFGTGDYIDKHTWTANTSVTGTQAIACGYNHTLRLKFDGTIEASGAGTNYRLGNNSTSDSNVFVASDSGAMGGQTAKSVWATGGASFVIRSDDALLAVGQNDSGCLGMDSNVAADSDVTTWSFVKTSNFSGETPVQVSTGQDGHTMMITASGKIYGTGYGANYRTGLNDTSDVNIFTQCTGDIQSANVRKVSTCTRASITLDITGNVWITGHQSCNGQLSDSDSQEFTKVTLPSEFYSKTIVNVFGGADNTFYAVDSEGTLWGVGTQIRGLGLIGVNGYISKLFTKVPIYDVVPKAFQYTPTLTLENPNPDYGATVEFKNPNNRAFINLDDQTSTLRLGFVDNEYNAGQFKGIQIAADGSLGGGSPLVINSNVGIGVESPLTKLAVQGDFSFDGGYMTTRYYSFQFYTAGGTDAPSFSVYTNGAYGMYLLEIYATTSNSGNQGSPGNYYHGIVLKRSRTGATVGFIVLSEDILNGNSYNAFQNITSVSNTQFDLITSAAYAYGYYVGIHIKLIDLNNQGAKITQITSKGITRTFS